MCSIRRTPRDTEEKVVLKADGGGRQGASEMNILSGAWYYQLYRGQQTYLTVNSLGFPVVMQKHP